jgi:hypothetical protein
MDGLKGPVAWLLAALALGIAVVPPSIAVDSSCSPDGQRSALLQLYDASQVGQPASRRPCVVPRRVARGAFLHRQVQASPTAAQPTDLCSTNHVSTFNPLQGWTWSNATGWGTNASCTWTGAVPSGTTASNLPQFCAPPTANVAVKRGLQLYGRLTTAQRRNLPLSPPCRAPTEELLALVGCQRGTRQQAEAPDSWALASMLRGHA